MMCYGSGAMAILPVSMAELVGAIARGGSLMPARLFEETRPPERTEPLFEERACEVVTKAMQAVVDDTEGTAYDVPGLRPTDPILRAYSVAAKTGTAELKTSRGPKNNAWIVGFAPVERPRFSVVVCLELVDDGRHGGDAAGPVLAEALRYLARSDPRLVKQTEAAR